MNKLFKHLKTVHVHRKYVGEACRRMKIPFQGLIHDLSKYSITELKMCKYWTGAGSPHEACRRTIGYSPSWIHHYHKNKHHFQYFWDESEDGTIIPIQMPYKYLIESFCDMVGAGKAYLKDKWTLHSPWDYYVKMCKGKRIINDKSIFLLEKLLWGMHEAESEEAFYKWYGQVRNYLKKNYEAGNTDY